MALPKIRAQMRAINPSIAKLRVEQINAALQESDIFKALDVLHPATGKDIQRIVKSQRPEAGSFWAFIHLLTYPSLDMWALNRYAELWCRQFQKMDLPSDSSSLRAYVIEMRNILQCVAKSE